AVNDDTADFFMWEYFTSKRYYNVDASPYPIKQIGEIYSPWSSWKIVARSPLVGKPELDDFLEKVDSGVNYFKHHEEEAVNYISTELDYEEADAREWMKTVQFPPTVRGVKKSVVEKAIEVLGKAGVVDRARKHDTEAMIGIKSD
ncbi:MAG: hypothetical protein Q9183_004538, partial [Haloplaca sp. 2 TL-2023]